MKSLVTAGGGAGPSAQFVLILLLNGFSLRDLWLQAPSTPDGRRGEELLFRGLLLPRLHDCFGRRHRPFHPKRGSGAIILQLVLS